MRRQPGTWHNCNLLLNDQIMIGDMLLTRVSDTYSCLLGAQHLPPSMPNEGQQTFSSL